MTESDTIPQQDQRYALEWEDDMDQAEFLKKARDMYQKDIDADRHNIEPAREDLRFTVGDQWEVNTKNRRTRLRKPVLTVNRLPAFIAQYLGSWQQTDTTMKLIPIKGGSKLIAEIRQGLIRTIVKSPQAKHATYTAMESAYISGMGSFGLELVENKFDVFAKDISFVAYDDPFQCVWDRASREPSGSDANHVFATRYMTIGDFKRAYPDATPTSKGWAGDELDYTVMTGHGWEVDEMIRVCHFWQMREEDCTVGLEKGSGDVIDITDYTQDQIDAAIQLDAEGNPIMRETVRPYAECYVLSGDEVLDGPFRMNVSRVPVFRVEGWALQEASVRYRWGFVRNAKDPQRLHNYWRSVLAEELMKSPASKWLLDKTAMKGDLADSFRNAHLSGDNVLFWDSQTDGAKPEFIPPPMLNQAVLTESQMTVQDIKDVTNKHEASLGVTSNEVSGKAISARQRVSELGDRIYLENMNMALEQAALMINDLIPEVYDTHRVIKITGDDDQVKVQEINGDFGDETPDITKGKYELTSTTGPSYATMREEAVETMLTLMNHMPQTGNYIADIIARNMDVPGSDEMAERLMGLLPPGMADLERLPERSRKRLEAQQEQAAQQQQQQQQLQMVVMQKEIEKLTAEVQEMAARATKQLAQAQLAASQHGVDAARVESDHIIGQESNLIKAATVGVSIDKNEIDMAKVGVDAAKAAASAVAPMERKAPNGPQSSEEGNGESV